MLAFNMKICLAQVLFAKIAPDDINLVCQVITVGCHLRKLKLGGFSNENPQTQSASKKTIYERANLRK